MKITGSCHCGNVSFTLDWPGAGEIAARSCGCTFCVKHGGVWTSNPRATLNARITRPESTNRYVFGTETAGFVVCGACGVPVFVTSEIDDHTYAVVNVNAFDNIPRTQIRIAPASFDSEDLQSRLERRRRGWIADVRVVEGRP
jgi:hypothetical protein